MNINRISVKNTKLTATLSQNVEVYEDNLITHTVILNRLIQTSDLSQADISAVYFQKPNPSTYYV
jgi:hypothetical protein